MPTKDVAIMQRPAKEAYVVPTGKVFITFDKEYMHKMMVTPLIIEGVNLVKPSALFAKELEAVPKKTATIRKK